MTMAKGPRATFVSKEDGWGLWSGLTPSERQTEVNSFQMKRVRGGGGSTMRGGDTANSFGACNAEPPRLS